MAAPTGAYSRLRRPIRFPIATLEGVEESLANLAGDASSTDAAVTMSTGAVHLGETPSVESAIIKYHLTRESTIHAMDVLGGKVIMLGPNIYLVRGYQGSAIGRTLDGSNFLTRKRIS
ncbi:acyl-CoA dehydrogenase, partial [Pseudoalteromonas sp. S979]